MNRAGALSVVDPILGEAHDLPTANDRLWDALLRNDLPALDDVLHFKPKLEARRVMSEQDELLQEQQEDWGRDDYDNEYRRPDQPLPLEYCLSNHQMGMARRLLVAGANPDALHSSNNTLLAIAVGQGIEAVNLLLEFGAEVNHFDVTSSSTALNQAARQLKMDIVERLLAEGAEVNLPDLLPQSCQPPYPRHRWLTPLACVLTQLEKPGAQAIAERLLAAGARVDLVDSFGTNALHHLTCERTDWVERLVALGADPNGKDKSGATPLHILVGWNQRSQQHEDNAPHQLAKAQALVRHGANLNAFDDDGRTPLLNLLRNHAPLALVRWMLDQGANPDLQMGDRYMNSARADLLRRKDAYDDDHGYVERTLQLLVQVEQQKLLEAVAEAEMCSPPDVSRRPRGRL